jgi:N-acetyl-anhydromuramyl-L-alanine amidase AmpD
MKKGTLMRRWPSRIPQRVLTRLAVVAALAMLVAGCGGRKEANSSHPVLKSPQAAPAAAARTPAPASRAVGRGPMSQAELSAIYNAPAASTASGGGHVHSATCAHTAPPPTAEYAVAADPSWDAAIAREWRHVVVHHSATPNGSMAAFDRAHRARGWDGVGYHFVIGNGTLTGDGEVEPTYRWRQQMAGAHAGNAEYNQHGIGICLVGDFENVSRPTPRQLASLRALVRFLQVKTGVPTCEVVGHDCVPGKCTDCPGKWMDMHAFRSSLGGGAIGVPIKYTRSAAPASSQVARSSSTRGGAALP